MIWGYYVSPTMYGQNAIAINEFLSERWSIPIEECGNTFGKASSGQRFIYNRIMVLDLHFGSFRILSSVKCSLRLCIDIISDMEDHWLGVWKYVLLGEWPNIELLDSIEDSLCEEEKCVLRIVLSKKCYLDVRSEASSSEVSVDIDSLMQTVFDKIRTTPDDGDKVECVRSPIILVLDFEVQMLPWENLPILRNQEVYHMPSVGSIVATLNRCCQDQAISFPLMDPVDLYYLLNPDVILSLKHTQVEFENWFQDQNFEECNISQEVRFKNSTVVLVLY